MTTVLSSSTPITSSVYFPRLPHTGDMPFSHQQPQYSNYAGHHHQQPHTQQPHPSLLPIMPPVYGAKYMPNHLNTQNLSQPPQSYSSSVSHQNGNHFVDVSMQYHWPTGYYQAQLPMYSMIPYNQHADSYVVSPASSEQGGGYNPPYPMIPHFYSNPMYPVGPPHYQQAYNTPISPILITSSPVASPYWSSPAAAMSNVQTTNVYIRGLQPTTTDEDLNRLVSQWGYVVSSKAIIDRGQGSCKGYGFARFTTIVEAQNCIQGMTALGLEAGFAKDSFNSKLKELSDHSSTNLYVSNLPHSWNEEDITLLFRNYDIKSNRLLRDEQGKSRGVAFVKFYSREVCDDVIDKLNGTNLNVEGHRLPLMVRYTDTLAQKRMKNEVKKVQSPMTNNGQGRGHIDHAFQQLHYLNKSWKAGSCDRGHHIDGMERHTRTKPGLIQTTALHAETPPTTPGLAGEDASTISSSGSTKEDVNEQNEMANTTL